MHFQRVNVTCYDAVNVIHISITTANPFPYTAKFKLKLDKSDVERQIEYVGYIVLSYIKNI